MAISKDFAFIGRLSLDFAQTGDMGYGARFERLRSPSDLRRWLSLSPLRLAHVRISKADLELAKRLRSALWRVASALLDGTAPKTSDVRLLNRLGRQPCLIHELAPDGQSIRWRQPTIQAALATLAQDAIMLFGEPAQRTRIHRCENTGCRVIFCDESRPGRRRWCAANRCGDRTRARLYRQRHLPRKT
jgi:predicted RNA-binding Zn ribbon-like protein